ncbi:MAG: retropepsin-like aspartic protease [Pseudomonadota bacterium]
MHPLSLIFLLFPLAASADEYRECVSPEGVRSFRVGKCAKGDRETVFRDAAAPVSRRVDGGGQAATTQVARAGSHFVGNGQVNGLPFRMLVDTGASYVSLSRDQALAAGVALSGMPVTMQTANGPVKGVLTRAATVAFAGHEVRDVAVVVQTEGRPYPGVLLGMSFLRNFDISLNGAVMSLTRK